MFKKKNALIRRYLRQLSSKRPELNLVQLNSIWLLTLVVTVATLLMFWIEFFFSGNVLCQHITLVQPEGVVHNPQVACRFIKWRN